MDKLSYLKYVWDNVILTVKSGLNELLVGDVMGNRVLSGQGWPTTNSWK